MEQPVVSVKVAISSSTEYVIWEILTVRPTTHSEDAQLAKMELLTENCAWSQLSVLLRTPTTEIASPVQVPTLHGAVSALLMPVSIPSAQLSVLAVPVLRVFLELIYLLEFVWLKTLSV
jgi:hypothetical protein